MSSMVSIILGALGISVLLGGIAIGAYRASIARMLPVAWAEAKTKEQTRDARDREGKRTGMPEPRWLLSGPNCTPTEARLLNWIVFPSLLQRWLLLFAVRLPLMFAGIAWRRVTGSSGTPSPPVRHDQVFHLFTHGPLLVAATLDEDANTLSFSTPSDFPLVTTAGHALREFTIELDVERQRIRSASWLGQDLTDDPTQVYACLMHIIVHWAHTQSHVLAERSAREIARQGIEELEPAYRHVMPLHSGLFYGRISPLLPNQFYTSQVSPETLIDAAEYRLPHSLSEGKLQFRYYRFLYRARGSIMRHLESTGLPVDGECLFNNMVVHSLDHACTSASADDVTAWSMDCSGSVRSLVASVVFRTMWVPSYRITYWISEERIGRMDRTRYPFFGRVYDDVVKEDREFADLLLCSTSF